jgi:FMN phosphatase YigB (HAD superfamily)
VAERFHPTYRPDDLADLVEKSAHAFVGFDIFDTLVARTVAPEQVKLLAADRLCRAFGWGAFEAQALYKERASAEHLLCLQSLKSNQESEFRFIDLASDLFERLNSRGWPVSQVGLAQFREAMIDCELAVERSVLRPVTPVIEALNLARAMGKRVVFLSDYYMTSQQVTLLLDPFKIIEPNDSLFVSSDHMASKRSGSLYEIVCGKLGIQPSALLMIGDNPYSDYAQARRIGAEAIQVRDPARVAFYGSHAANVTHGRPRSEAFQNVLAKSTLSENRNFRALIPCLFLFAEKLYAAARRDGIDDLFFMAREGQALREMFDIYQDSLGFTGLQRIRTHYLLVSRRACYGASLRPLEHETFEGIFRIYRRLSLRGFLRSLGFEPRDVERLAAEVGTDADEMIDNFPDSRPFDRLRRSDLFRRIYEPHRLTQRGLLRTYINQFGAELDRQPLALVDVGWKGSIQDYLQAALPDDIRVKGYYLGLIGIGQPVENKSGLLFTNVPTASRYYRTYTENRTVFELLLCADHGSAEKYQAREDGTIGVVIDANDDELNYISSEFLPPRNDLIQAFREFCRIRNLFCVSPDDMERFAARTHASLVFRPWQANARSLVRAQHRENFGIFAISRYSTGARLTLRNRCEFWLRLARKPRATLNASFWPAFTLQQHMGKLVTRLYAIGRRFQDRRAAQASSRAKRKIG